MMTFQVLVIVFTCSLSGTSFAHVFPDHSDPRVGATVQDPPAWVRIWFDGALEPAFCTVVVRDENGKQVDKGNVQVDPDDATLIEVGLPPLPAGTYRVIWNVVARDGHRTEGDYTFDVK
ncbi:MAG: copper resistance protein CopC [Candidatus Sulfobium sp.]